MQLIKRSKIIGTGEATPRGLKEFDTVESVDVVMELASHGCICLGGLLFVLLSENRHLQQREQKCFQLVCQILKRMFLHGMNLVSCLEV